MRIDRPRDGQSLTPPNRSWLIAGTSIALLLANSVRAEDTDGDGLSNEWEIRYGLNHLVSDKDQPGDGSDGSLVVAAGNTLILAPASTVVTGLNPAGAMMIQVATSTGFADGDLVLLRVAQDAVSDPATNTAGRYQLARITSRGPTTLHLASPLVHAFNAGAGRLIFVQKVPEFSTVTIGGTLEAKPWDATGGGILAFCARTTNVAAGGKISAIGKGFRGGTDYSVADVDGFRGESHLSPGDVRTTAALAGAGGGGGRSWLHSGNGGGGGGYAASGGGGGFLPENVPDRDTAYLGGSGGAVYGFANLDALLPGSGGGSGGQDGDNAEDVNANGGKGGAGGGVIFLLSGQLTNGGIISANGESGGAGLGGTERGGGGGGSGGAIYLMGDYGGSGTLEAGGGVGGTAHYPSISGGTGGAGRIRCDLRTASLLPTSQPAVGFRGDFPAVLSAPAISLGSYGDADFDGLDTLAEAQADTHPFDADSDDDGLPDKWEVTYNVGPTQPSAGLDPDVDGLSNIREFHLGTHPMLADGDGDGLSDTAEIDSAGSDPNLADSDGDGLPDGWERSHGLDPGRNDAGEDHDHDFISNRDEYNDGTGSTNPSSSDSDGDGNSDYSERYPNANQWAADYDRNNRLLGVRHARGSSFVHGYDGNGNPVRQAKLGLDTDGDGLSDLWEFVHGLNHQSASGNDGTSGDPDGDGWTNLQEQAGGTAPTLAGEKPGANGKVISSFSTPFLPTAFVSSTGQLDIGGSEEIAVGADGDVGSQINHVRLLSEGPAGWQVEEIPVGSYGVTSLAITRLPGRPSSVYVGLRSPVGTGRLIEATKVGGIWQTTTVTESLGSEVRLLGGIGSDTTGRLLFSAATSFGSDGGLYSATWNNGIWNVEQLDSDPSHRGNGIVTGAEAPQRSVRLLDRGGIEASEMASYPSFEEFDGTSINSQLWTPGGGTDSNASVSRGVSSGLLQLSMTWNSSGDGSNTLETPNIWSGKHRGMLIHIPSASHQVSKPTQRAQGSVWAALGGTRVFEIGPKTSRSNVWIQLHRTDAGIRFRNGTGSPVTWGAWGTTTLAGPLLFGVEGYNGPDDNGGNAHIHVDFIRFQSTSGFASDLDSFPSDYDSASKTWFFKFTGAMLAKDFQIFARAHGGNTVTLDSAANASWLQTRFGNDFWIGQHRESPTAAWKWQSGSKSTYANWQAGQPGTDPGQRRAFVSGGSWVSASDSESKAGVFEMKSETTEPQVESEPTAVNRIEWPAQSLASGLFNPSSPAQASIVDVFVDDKDASGTTTTSDDLVVAEYVLGSTPAEVRTLDRRPLIGVLPSSYGVTAARTKDGTSDLLVTAENDGSVYAWMPPAGGGALTRHLISVEHSGKRWHGLSRVAMGGRTDGVAGLRVSPGSPQSVDVVFWSPTEIGFSAPPVILQSPPRAAIASTPADGGAIAPVHVAVWDSEGNPSRIAVQFQNPPGSGSWQDATLSTIAGQPASAQPLLAAPPSGQSHVIAWNAVADLGPSFHAAVLLRARASDASGTGPWSDAMYYAVNVTSDSDGDGMPNDWEQANGLNPNVHDSESDTDHDTLKNLIEFAIGSNPQSGIPANLPVVFLGNASGAPATAVETRYLTMTVAKNPSASALHYAVEISGDLATWDSGDEHLMILEQSSTQMKVRSIAPVAGQSRRAMRLKVTAP